MKKLIALLLLFIFSNLFITGCNQSSHSTRQDPLSSTGTETSPHSFETPLRHEDGRSIVTLSIYSPDETTRQAIIAFNETNPDYYVELLFGIDITDVQSINRISATEYWEQEMLDIFAGKGPDIFTKTLQTSYNEYVEKAVNFWGIEKAGPLPICKKSCRKILR